LPSAFRRGKDSDSFVLLQWRPPALTLLPDEAWKDVSARLKEYRRQSKVAWENARRITAASIPVSPDSQGRILIPARHQAMASLDGSALIVGVMDQIEIWNPELYEAQSTVSDGGFEAFAQQIFG
jgi:MraZ protein